LGFRFDHPVYLWLLLLAVPIVWLGLRSLATLDRTRRWTAIGLRVAVLVIIVLMLAGFQAVRTHSELTVMAVVDQSESVRRFAQPPRDISETDTPSDKPQSFDEWSRAYLSKAVSDRKTDDRVGMVGFDGRPTVKSMPSDVVDLDGAALDAPEEGTDIASAIRLAMAMFPADSNKRLVLFSDGNDTGTDDSGGGSEVLAAAREAAAAGIPIDIVPVDYQLSDEVMVEGVYAPTEAREGQTVAVRVVLRAASPATGKLFLKHDGETVDLAPRSAADSTPVEPDDWTREELSPLDDPDAAGKYVAVKLVELPLAFSGANRFEATFEPDAGSDSMMVNNSGEAFTLVQGKGRVLLVDNLGAASARALPEALQRRGITVETVPPSLLPRRLGDMQKYDAIIMRNVPAEVVGPSKQRALARYVNDLGGGFMMVGGPESFGAGGWTNSPIDAILPVECQVPSMTVLPSGALVFVIDRSGSMSSNVGGTNLSQQQVANEAAVLALSTLYPQDMVGVVAFDNSAKWVVSLHPNQDPEGDAKRIRSITPGGGTNIYPGLEKAYEALKAREAQENAVKHVILLTDGHSQNAKYYQVVKQMRQANITLSTVGVGNGHNNQILAQLAKMGSGNYYPVSNPNNLPQIFVKEARSIRRNLVKEQPFTPKITRTDSPMVSGLSQPPALRGLVLTGEKKHPLVYTAMVSDDGAPVFAHWQVGLGRSAAFTSDANARWANAWLRWGGYTDFWSRTVREIARPSASRELDLTTSIAGNTMTIRLDAANMAEDESFSNFMKVVGSVVTPDGEAAPVTLEQTGPGIYEATVPADQSGSYIVNLFANQPDGERRVVFGGASKTTGGELRRFRSNRALLEQIAQTSGGRVLDPAKPRAASLFSRESLVESRSIRPLWRLLLPWLLALFLLDVACRRIAWDLGAMRKSVVGAGAKVQSLFATRQVESKSTLGALKQRARQVDRELDERSGRSQPADSTASVKTDISPPTEQPDSKRKFDAAPDATAREDFAAAVGGASEGETASASVLAAKRRQATRAESEEDEGQTTSKLLAAKRAARERMKEEGDS